MAGTYTMTVVGEDKASAVLGKIGVKAQETTNKVDGLGKSGGGLKSLAGGLGGVLGAIGGAGIIAGIGDSVKAFTELGGAVKGIQRVAGGSIEDASRLRTEFELSGISAESGANAVKKLEVGLVNAGKTTKGTADMTKLLGVAFTDAHGQVLPMSTLMPELAERFKTMPDGAAKTALAVKLFGKNGTEMLPFLNKGAAGLKDMAAKSDKLGLTLSGDSLKALGKSKTNARDMAAAMKGLQVSIGQYVLPVITALTTFLVSHVIPAFAAVMKWIKDNPTLVKILATAIGVLVLAFKAMEIVTTITKAMTAFKIAQGATTVAQAALNAVMAVNPFVLIGIAIVALVVIFVVLWKKSAGFRDFFIGIWHAIKTATLSVLGALKTAMQAVWNAIKRAIEVVWGAIKAVTTSAWNTIKVLILNPIQAVWNWIKNVFGSLGGWFAGLFHGIVGAVTGIWHGVTGVITGPLSSAWDWIQRTFSKITGFIAGIWHSVISDASNILGGIGNAVGNAFGVIVDILKTPINGVIGAINWVIDQIDKISITLPAFLGGYHIGFSIGHIPELAAGGPMAAGSLALVGERGPELFRAGSTGRVIPNNAIGGGGDTHIHLHLDGAAVVGSEDEICRRFVKVWQTGRRRGAVPAGALAR